MSPDIVVRSFRDRLRLLVIASAGLAALTLGIVPIYTSMAPQLAELMSAYPPELLIALGVGDLSSPIGFLNAELFSLILPIVAIGLGIVIGVAAIAGEEDARTINVLLSHPVSRRASRGPRPLRSSPCWACSGPRSSQHCWSRTSSGRSTSALPGCSLPG